jgi:hypothetical protein
MFNVKFSMITNKQVGGVYKLLHINKLLTFLCKMLLHLSLPQRYDKKFKFSQLF